MKIHGVFCWYDESPSWLGTAIAGLARFADHIVAVDGAYALYPGGKAKSHPHQAEVILHTAEAQGVACTLYQPSEVWWGNEVEKRNKSLDIVGAYAEDGDWLCVFDADYHVQFCKPDSLKHELAVTTCEVATYGLTEGEDWLANGAQTLAVTSKLNTEWITRTRDLYRFNTTLRVGPAHGDYSIEKPLPREGTLGDLRDALVANERSWLRGPYDLEPAHDVTQFLTVAHRTKHRVMVRREAQQGYYRQRDILGVEDQSGALA